MSGCESWGVRPRPTCVLLYSGEGLLEGVGSSGALSGVGRQAVGVHRLHGGVSVGLVRDAGEAVDDGRDDAGHGRGGYIGWWRTEAWWEEEKKQTKKKGFLLNWIAKHCVLRQNDAGVHSRKVSYRLRRVNINTRASPLVCRNTVTTWVYHKSTVLFCLLVFLWSFPQDSWGGNLWKMSLSTVFVRYPAGSHC